MNYLSALLLLSAGTAQAQSVFYDKSSMNTIRNDEAFAEYHGMKYPLSVKSDRNGLKIRYALNSDASSGPIDEIREVTPLELDHTVLAVRIDSDGVVHGPAPATQVISEIKFATQNEVFNGN